MAFDQAGQSQRFIFPFMKKIFLATIRPTIVPILVGWLLVFSSLRLLAQENPFVMPDDRARELAYFGDIPGLRQLCGPELTLKALEKSSHASAGAIFIEALKGESWEVISLLVEYGWPEKYFSGESLSYTLSPRAVPELANRVPDFAARIGNDLMRYAMRQGNIPLAKALQASGVALHNAEEALISAVAQRDMGTLAWLLAQGADPEKPQGRNAVTVATMLKSADLLTKLDRSGQHTAEIAELRKQYSPNSADATDIPGRWAHRKDGFGSVVFDFYPDGTGTFSGDMGSLPVLWSANAQSIKVADLKSVAAGQSGSFEIIREKQALVLTSEKGNAQTKLVRERNAYERPAPTQKRHRPERIRLQTAALDSSGELWIGVNGRHLHVPLAELIAAAAKTDYGFDPVSGNILDWETFSAGAVSDNILKQAYVIPLDSRSADPRYSPKWQELYVTHGQPAVLIGNSDYTLFRGNATLPVHLDPSPKVDPEYLLTFALLSRQPLSNGKRWVLIFLRRGRDDFSGP